jgi:CHAT domain-containing protein/Tfp pilus assembly protein PilF
MNKKLAPLFLSFLTLCAFGFANPARPQDAQVNAAEALRKEGRYAEAITALQGAMAILQARKQLETPSGATLLNNLGELHYQLGRYAEAIPYYERAISLAGTGGVQPQLGINYRNLGIVYQLTGRTADAIAAYKNSVAILSRLPGDRVQLASTLNNIATLFEDQKRYGDAEKLLQQAMAIYREAFGENHLYVATAYSNLGTLYETGGDLGRAEMMLLSANKVMVQVFDRDHPRRVTVLRNLGWFYTRKKDWPKAVAYFREALVILQKQSERSSRSRQGELAATELDPGLQRTAAGEFVNASMHLLMEDQSQGVALTREIFKVAQWRPSQAAASLLQMSARASATDDELSGLLRRRQDLVGEWQTIQQRLTQAALTNEGSAQTAQSSVGRLDRIGGEISSLDANIASRFPDYADLTNPAPLDVTEVQALLREDEALVLVIETGSPTWVWVVSKTDKSLALVNLSSEALAAEVANLRCGLDQSNWSDSADWPESTQAEVQRKRVQKAALERCRSLGRKPSSDGSLPFDLDRAHRLYKLFLGPAEKAIAGKHLLIVPSQSLMQLPFTTLVTEQPAPGTNLRDVKWLGTTAPISILPSVSSLRALRRVSKPSQASKPFLGFGNPLLNGDPSAAKLARSKQTCASERLWTASTVSRPVRAPMKLRPSEAFRGGLADVRTLKAQMALPETADELCAVAKSLKAKPEDVFLGERATETTFKNLNKTGSLANYRVIHFATHGLVSGDLPGVSEPALLLTPPETATTADDGLLTASEVSQTKLDANWVVLSACNTDSGGSQGAEALSGLAKAFFYAGSRALLVTHWEIESDAAVKLTTGAFSAMENNPRLSQAEAMRTSMAALVSDQAISPHPATWAAFALIGDGGRR